MEDGMKEVLRKSLETLGYRVEHRHNYIIFEQKMGNFTVQCVQKPGISLLKR